MSDMQHPNPASQPQQPNMQFQQNVPPQGYGQVHQQDPAAIARAQHQYENESKSVGIAYLLWFFLGVFGAHRFYMGHTGVGVAQLFTLGGLGLWVLIDAFLIPSRVRDGNEKTRVNVYLRNRLPAY